MNKDFIQQVFSRAPELADFTPDDFAITRLAGYTNQNFRLYNHQQDWILRIPRAKTDRFIDREAEALNQTLASQLQIAPQVSWRDHEGITLTPTLSTSRALCAADFGNDTMLQIIVEPIQRLHRSGLSFRGKVNLQELLSNHFEILNEHDQQRLGPRLRQAERVLKLLRTRDAAYVASHNDLVLGNLMFDNTRLWLIDWEYSAMASPYWDLATLCNAAKLDLAQSQRLLRTYCAGSLVMEDSILFDYRELLKLLSDCWMAALAD
jgi:thiamine kinase-like enzyme